MLAPLGTYCWISTCRDSNISLTHTLFLWAVDKDFLQIPQIQQNQFYSHLLYQNFSPWPSLHYWRHSVCIAKEQKSLFYWIKNVKFITSYASNIVCEACDSLLYFSGKTKMIRIFSIFNKLFIISTPQYLITCYNL